MDKTAIVILNWNGVNMLTRFLPNVLDYSRDEAVVYVADNASTDNSVEILKRHFPEVRLIIFDRNWGFAEGYNKALEQIEAEYYVLLNSDVEVSHHWLTPLTEFMDNQRIQGNLFQLLNAAMSFIFKHLSLSGTTDTLEREEHLTVPYKAVREGVVNALTHRSYREAGGSVGVAVYDDRVEIDSSDDIQNELFVSGIE